ncbi:MAG: hypothetical protein ACE5G2_05215 [Candidatus Krumholzibacteriia bacterium]
MDLISQLKSEKKQLEVETTELREAQLSLERKTQALTDEKEELFREGQTLRDKEQEWVRYERDREEIRARIDGMLAKFEQLEI